jgi:hypothetical protein
MRDPREVLERENDQKEMPPSHETDDEAPQLPRNVIINELRIPPKPPPSPPSGETINEGKKPR